MASGFLTTHVLDTALGVPAHGMRIELYRLSGEARTKLAEKVTNNDGRTDGPILAENEFETGSYELVFHTGDYQRLSGQTEKSDENLFLSTVPIRFTMTEQDHYHVPLLFSPFSFSTYRGS